MDKQWIQLLDGSYIQARHVTRMHITEDITKPEGRFSIVASITGPAHPFIVARFEDRAEAQGVLENLIES